MKKNIIGKKYISNHPYHVNGDSHLLGCKGCIRGLVFKNCTICNVAQNKINFE
jgi:hypothetical protein